MATTIHIKQRGRTRRLPSAVECRELAEFCDLNFWEDSTITMGQIFETAKKRIHDRRFLNHPNHALAKEILKKY